MRSGARRGTIDAWPIPQSHYVVVVNIGRLASPAIRRTFYGKDGGQLRQFVNILTVPVHPQEAYCTALYVRRVNTTSTEGLWHVQKVAVCTWYVLYSIKDYHSLKDKARAVLPRTIIQYFPYILRQSYSMNVVI
jgi:hypothetical protein